MKNIIFGILAIVSICSCRKAQIVETRSIGDPCPWSDSSGHHPKDAALKPAGKISTQRVARHFIIDK
jgi:hypothetical protein